MAAMSRKFSLFAKISPENKFPDKLIAYGIIELL